ncbi:hypothetical protein [Halorubrum aethiopicum]|uniref:hypothetical protein n=1 Tax=Halorubrum aethiopicum TaxID=1758255 RepID=UPI000832706B|nr:hypothetical protein [Halorubrum aethiopicum]
MGLPDTIAPLTTEHHYTELTRIEHTRFGIDLFYHQVPLDWFLVISGEIDAWTHEFFRGNRDLFEGDYSVVAVDFDYDVDPNPDGTGKTFHVLFCDSVGKERKCYPRAHYLLRLLEYDEDIYEVVAVNPTDKRDGVLVAIQERLPHVPNTR